MPYNKDFDQWNLRKEYLNNREQTDFFYEKEIWWCSLGVNVGSEQDGKNNNFERPVLVFKKFNKNLLLILPFTKASGTSKYFYQFPHSTQSYIVLSQIRLISSKRLLRKMSSISQIDYETIRSSFIEILFFR